MNMSRRTLVSKSASKTNFVADTSSQGASECTIELPRPRLLSYHGGRSILGAINAPGSCRDPTRQGIPRINTACPSQESVL